MSTNVLTEKLVVTEKLDAAVNASFALLAGESLDLMGSGRRG